MGNLLSLLPYLLCPIGMGFVMWLMMREGKGETPDTRTSNKSGESTKVEVDVPTSPGRLMVDGVRKVFSIVGMCLNPKVLAGLAIAGLAIWVLAPNLLWTALPLLIVVVCPLSMLLMAWGMRGARREEVKVARSKPNLTESEALPKVEQASQVGH